MRLIVTSATDIAGTNIYHELAKAFGFEQDGEFEDMPLYKRGDVWLINTWKNQTRAEHLDEFFDAEYYVFASRHRSESGERTLTVHVTGNLTDQAKVGGNPKELAFCNPDAMKVALRGLKVARDEGELDYRVSMEATHHGPTALRKPVLFVEVGSTEKEWRDPAAVSAVARAALAAAGNRERFPRAVGLGGNHYAPIHTKVMLETDTAVGHIVPSYAIMEVGADVLKQAVEKTGAAFGLLDWKGMNRQQRARIKELAKEIGLDLKRTKDLKRSRKEGIELTINSDLLTWAFKAAPKEVEEGAAELGAVILKDGKGRPTGKVATEDMDVPEGLTYLCLDIVLDSYDARLEGEAMVITERRFDPRKAEELGIPPGPLYGKLSSGQEVEVEGRTITPDMVTKTVKTVLSLEGEPLKEKIYLYMKGKSLQKEAE
jgi:D-aminoacyl-tRNA deacylase